MKLLLADWPKAERCPRAARLYLKAWWCERDWADGTRRDRAREVRRTAELALEWGLDIPADLVGYYEGELERQEGDVLYVVAEEFPGVPSFGRSSRRSVYGGSREDPE